MYSECVDSSEKFQISNGNTKSCKDAARNSSKWCARPVFKKNCPYSCNECSEDEHLPLQAASELEDDCLDSLEKFVLPNGNEKSCIHAQRNATKWCSRQIFKENCKASCNTCLEGSSVTECRDEDWDVKYELEKGDSKKSCEDASRNDELCRHKELREKCRVTCGQCDFPSATPSLTPSSIPSTQFPSSSPSTKAPVQEHCVIDGNLRYPKVDQRGYHSDM